MERTVVYHQKTGPENTDLTLRLAVEAASERGVATIVVASRSGATASALMDRIEGTELRLVVVTPQYGYMEHHDFDRSLIPQIREAGHEFYAGTMPFHTDAFHGCEAVQRMGDVLRTFGHGVQVCVEIGMMACDGGVLELGRPCVLVAGTSRGADTAILATPASSADLDGFRVHELLCKPLLMEE